MEQTDLTEEDRDLDLEVIGLAAPNVCILLTGTTHATMQMARRIHSLGRGRPGRFRAVNCSWPESLLDEHLFHTLRPGSSGTLFLEEVGRLSAELQERLLETLDAMSDPRSPLPPRARVMASSSEPLYQRALEGRFNERLLYRLNAIHLVVPPDHNDR